MSLVGWSVGRLGQGPWWPFIPSKGWRQHSRKWGESFVEREFFFFFSEGVSFVVTCCCLLLFVVCLLFLVVFLLLLLPLPGEVGFLKAMNHFPRPFFLFFDCEIKKMLGT